MDIPETLTPVEAAELLGVERRTIIRWCQQRVLEGYQLGKLWYVRKDSVANALSKKKGGE